MELKEKTNMSQEQTPTREWRSRVEGVGFKGSLLSNFPDLPPFPHDQDPRHCVGIHALARRKPPFQARELQPQHLAVRFCLTHKAKSPVLSPKKGTSYHPSSQG
jgi:hypothetical protein